MTKVEEYRRQLRRLRRWQPFLMKASGLPGPRGNLELAAAAALEASPSQIDEFLAIAPEQAPENSPHVFLVFCGVLALGRLIAAGERKQFGRLRSFASDPRWRVREAVAMALQTIGDTNGKLLLQEARRLSRGDWYEKRAAAAGIAEPRLLKSESSVRAALEILDSITGSITGARDRQGDSFKTLRQGMGYCWSVVVAAQPAAGKHYIEKWLGTKDKDVRWILTENLKKTRLIKADPEWVQSCLRRLRA